MGTDESLAVSTMSRPTQGPSSYLEEFPQEIGVPLQEPKNKQPLNHLPQEPPESWGRSWPPNASEPGGERYPLTRNAFGRKMPPENMNARAVLERFFYDGLGSVDPEQAVSRALRFRGTLLALGRTRIDLDRFRRIYALGAGKAAAGMLRGLMKAVPTPIAGGGV